VGSKCAPKGSVNSVGSVRERTPQWVTCVSSFREGTFYFSQIYTEEQNTQHSTEILSQPISQNVTATFSSNALCALYAEGVLWARTVRQKAQWTLCALWEKKLPSELLVCQLMTRVRTFSHRVTQKYREHSPLCTFVSSVYLCCSVRKRRLIN